MTQPIQAVATDPTDIPDHDFDDEAPLMSHAYDGIREYDNPLPGWWRAVFVGSIVFAGFYGLYFHVVGWGASPHERYQVALADYQRTRSAARGEVTPTTEASIERDSQDDKILVRGREVFVERCVACHKEHGEGLIGPNLTDKFQKHGSSRLDIYNTIRGGVTGTPMLAWGEQMPMTDVKAVAAYVTTLRGTNVAGKAPEGQPVGAF